MPMFELTFEVRPHYLPDRTVTHLQIYYKQKQFKKLQVYTGVYAKEKGIVNKFMVSNRQRITRGLLNSSEI